MNLSLVAADNIMEVLAKIFDFTRQRNKILLQNIQNVDSVGFVPKDLDVNIFTELMTHAISEYIRTKRLLLCDGDTVKFGKNGSFHAVPIVDKHAEKFLKNDTKKYMELQLKKVSENMLNSKLAAKLLRDREIHCDNLL